MKENAMKKYKSNKTKTSFDPIPGMKFDDLEVDEKFICNDTKYIVNSKEIGTVPSPSGDIEVGILEVTNIRLNEVTRFYFMKEDM